VSSGTFSNLAAGAHTVIVRDAAGCTNTANITITQLNNTVTGTTTKTDVTCAGPNTGSITVTGAGGTPPYQYALGTGAYQTSGSFTNLPTGNYTVHVRDANLCITDLPVVTIAAAVNTVTSSITSQTNVSCAGGNTGAVTVAGAGGTGPYTYQLDGTGAFVSSGTFSNLAAGAHTVIVRDAAGCTNTANITITQLNNTVTATMTKTDVTCAGLNTGAITVTGSGGTTPYQYALGTGAYQTSGLFSNLAAGTYAIHIRDANQCIKDTSITIVAAGSTVTVGLVSKTDVSCAGNDGSITVAGAGGAAPYTYQLGAAAFQTAPVFNNLAAGNYTITAKDAAGCTNATVVTIVQLNNTVGAVFSAQTNVSCAPGSTGSFTISGTGGTGPYNYRLGTGIYQPNGTFSGLAVGTYAVSVRDANSCTKDTTITIVQTANTVTGSITAKTDIACTGNTGSVTVAGSGGTAPYEYRIGNGAFQAGNVFSDLPAGSYTIGVRDAVGCIANIPVTISQLATTLTVAVAAKTDIPCTGGTGSVTVTAGGGTSPYTYKIGTGAYQAGSTFTDLPAGNYIITVQDALGCTRDVNVNIVALPNTVTPVLVSRTDVPCSGGNVGSLSVGANGGAAPYQYKLDNGAYQATGVFTGLASGSYIVTVRDANGCTRDLAVAITQVPNTVVAGVASKVDVSCAGTPGSVTITGSGGTPPYTYKLGAGAFQASPAFSNVPAGNYIATVRDANGCTSDIAVTIVQLNNTVLPVVTSKTDIPCTGGTGSVTVAGSGGTAPYQYSLGGAAFQATGVFNGLAAGSYNITVRDAGGCTKDVAIIIEQAVNTVVGTVVAKTDVPCSGGNVGTLTVAGSGGTAPYTYRLGTGAFQPTGVFNNLAAGAHIITVRDANGCTSNVTGTIAQLNNTVDGTVVARRDVPCSGGNTGSITIAGTGGTAPYEYKLGTAQYRADGTFIGLPAGNYIITVKDAAGCTKDVPVTIGQINNNVVAVLNSKTDVSCLGGNTGSITISGSGGTAPYEYKIGTGRYGSANTFSNLAPGEYIVSVQDALGCSRDLTVRIDQLPNAITATINNKTDIPCAGGNGGSVSVTGGGGTAPYAYKLGSGQFSGNSTFTNLAAGQHIITVRDATGCSKDTTITIVQTPNTVRPSVISRIDIPCSGGTGSITVTGVGGTAPYEYRLGTSPYQPGGSFTELVAGSYTVTVRDAGGCTRDTTLVISQIPNTVTVTLGSKTDVGCASGNIGSITVVGSGGTAPYEYRIGSAAYQTSNTFNSLPAGRHVITVRDAAGCTNEVAVTLTQINNTVTATVTKTDVPCTGGNTGSITVQGGGGSTPYTYKLDSGAYQPGGTFNGLAAGRYVITIRNSLGCTKDTTVVVDQVDNTIIARIGSQKDVPCAGGNVGSVTIVATGGSGVLQYKIGTRPNQNTGVFNDLAAGDYVATVTDIAGCTRDVPVTIAQINNTINPAIATKTDVPCSGGNTGSVTISVTGGNAPFTYKMDTGPYQQAATFDNLAAGEHVVTVKDSAGCTKDLKVTIEQVGNTVAATVTKTDVPCSGGGGTATVTATGGTAPYTYKIDNGQYGPDATFDSLPGGEHVITVKDAAGCTKDVTVTIASPAGTPGTITPATVDPICAGTSQVLTASDGVAYQWYRNDTLIPGATGKTYSANTAARYTVVIDNGTCKIRSSNVVTLTVNSCTETVVFVAKAFTPDNNNLNDKLAPKFINVKQFRYFKVFNRWGQLVFQTTVIGEGWDGVFKGVRQPMETYSWILECVDNNGKTIKASGKTILIR
ncbi:T9SS type B sorting domain-containing protein, partial [Flavitalea antarctica]